MRKTLKTLLNFANDEGGAALVEYTVLLGILVVAVVGTITLVAGWVKGSWTAFCADLAAATTTAC